MLSAAGTGWVMAAYGAPDQAMEMGDGAWIAEWLCRCPAAGGLVVQVEAGTGVRCRGVQGRWVGPGCRWPVATP